MSTNFLRPSRSTKKLGLVLIGGSLILGPVVGCGSSAPPPPDDQIAAASTTHVYPTWWWWYMHRPYFATPMYSSHTVFYVGSGGSYSHVGASYSSSSRTSYSSARSVSGAKSGGGSFKGGSSISARGGFSGGHSAGA